MAQTLSPAFYGPMRNRAAFAARMRAIANNPKERARLEGQLKQVTEGSDVLQGRTDQGSGNDPNVRGPGRVKVPGDPETYNYFGGGPGGHRGAEKFATDRARRIQEANEKAKVKSPQTADTPPAQGFGDEPGPGSDAGPQGEVEFGTPELQQGGKIGMQQGDTTTLEAFRATQPKDRSEALIRRDYTEKIQQSVRDAEGSFRTLMQNDIYRNLSPEMKKEVQERYLDSIEEDYREGAWKNPPLGGGEYHEGPPVTKEDLEMGGKTYKDIPGLRRDASYRLDRAIDQQAQPRATTGTIGVQIEHNGTKAKATTKTDGELFDKTRVKTNNAPIEV